MRNSSFVVALSLACGAEGASPAGSGSAGVSSPSVIPTTVDGSEPARTSVPIVSARPATAPVGDVQPEMIAFLAMLDGSDDCVPRALRKHGKSTLDDKDMSMYMLRDARVIATDKRSDTRTCYDFEAQGGSVTYTFEGVCWEGGKIVSVKRERPPP